MSGFGFRIFSTLFSNWSPTSSPLQTHDVQIVEVFRKTSLSGANADGVVVLTGYGFVGVAGHSRKLPEANILSKKKS